MRKVSLVLAVLVLVGLIAKLACRRSAEPWQPKTRLTFVRFGTTGTTTNAEFGAEHMWDSGDRVYWFPREISHRKGTNWVAWSDELAPLSAAIQFAPTWPTNGSNFDMFVLIPVETTSSVSRIVIELQRAQTGVAGIFEKMREFVAIRRGRDIDTAYRGPRFFLTNETVVK